MAEPHYDQNGFLKIGSIELDDNGEVVKIDRGPSAQGWVFKDAEAYDTDPTKPCYVPELNDDVYTGQDFLDLAGGVKEVADMIFDVVDWQSPETYFNECCDEGEIDDCKACGKLFLSYGAEKCPHCGAPYDSEEPGSSIKLDLSITVTDEDIDDIMVGALEGGINYWCSEAEVVGEYLGKFASEQISKGGMLKIWVDEPFDEEDTEFYWLNKKKLMAGIKMYFEDPAMPYDIFDRIEKEYRIDTCQADAVVCDMIVQFALFGEIVYG